MTGLFKSEGSGENDRIVVVETLLTTCTTPGDVLPLLSPSPAYVAFSTRAPAVDSATMQDPAATLPVQLLTPSPTVTLPVGVGPPTGDGVTV